MAFQKQKEIDFLTILVTSWLLVTLVTATTNIDCRGKAFHCYNSTHFKICVDFGDVSKTVDDFLIPCPQNTVCTDSNYFECEYETTTSRVTTVQSDVTKEPFPMFTPTFWDNFNVTTNKDEQRIDLFRSSTTSPSQLAFVLPVTEKLERITHTPANKLHKDIIFDSEDVLYNTTFNKTRDSENSLRPSTTTNKVTTIPHTEVLDINMRLPADITSETFTNTERIEDLRNNFLKSIETATSASTKYSERMLSNFSVNIPLNGMQRYANERNNTPTTQTMTTPSTIFALPETQSDISHFTGSTDSYIEKTSQNITTRDFNFPVTPTENDIAQNLLVSNTNIFENSDNGIRSLALSETLILSTETYNETIYSLTTVNKPSSDVENDILILKKNNLSLPVITETSSTTKIPGEYSSYMSQLIISTDSNRENMHYDTKFGELNCPNMSKISNEFYTEDPKIALTNKINVMSLPEGNVNKMNEILSTELNKTLTLPSEPYNENISFMTTERDLIRLKNKSISVNANTDFFKDDVTETPSSISSSTNLIHFKTDVTHEDTKLEDKNVSIKSTSDVYEFYTEKDVVNGNDQSKLERKTRKNTIDVTTLSTLSKNLISTLATNSNKKPSSIAVNTSVTKIPNESTIIKNNNLSLSVIPEFFTNKNIVTDTTSDSSNIISLGNSYTETTTQQMKVKNENISIKPITHIYDLFTNNNEMTPSNMTKDLSFNKNGTHSVLSNTLSVDFTPPIIYESKFLVTNAVNENKNTVKKLPPYIDIDLSSTMMNNYSAKDQHITENILMDTLSYSSTEPYVSNANQNPDRDYTINVHDSFKTTESANSLSMIINFLELKGNESSINLHDPSITNGKDIVNVEQNKNNSDSLTQKADNNILFTKPPNYRTSINFDNVLQKNENNSDLTTNIFDILSHTTPTVDYIRSTENNLSTPTRNIFNNTVLDLLATKYLLKINVNNKYAAKLDSQTTSKSTFLDRSNSLITDIEAGTSILEVNSSVTSVTVSSLSTRPVKNRSKNTLKMLKPDLNINPNVNDIERVFKTTSSKKPLILFENHTNKDDLSNIRSLPISDSNKFKTHPKNLFSYISNVSLADVENSTGYLTTQSIKKVEDIIRTKSFDLPVTTVNVSDKLPGKIEHYVTESDSSYFSAKTSPFTYKLKSDSDVLKPAKSELNRSYFQSLENDTTLVMEHKYVTKVNIIAPSYVISTKLVYVMPDAEETNLTVVYNRNITESHTNVIHSDTKITESKNPSNELFTNSIQHSVHSEKEATKNVDNNLTLESHTGNTSSNIGSIYESQTVTENTELMNMNAQINISKTFRKLKNYTALESSNSRNSNAIIPQVFNEHYSNKSLIEKSQDSNSSPNINNLELLENVHVDKDTLVANTQVESYSSFAIINSSEKITENKDKLNKLKYTEIDMEREKSYRSYFNNETKLSAETYVNPVNDSKNNLMAIHEENNTNNYSIIKCKDNNTREGCSKRNKDFTKLSATNNNVTNSFEISSPFVTNCDNRHRGKYSDKNDCKFFYICLGKGQPIFGKCPNNTVFSEILKQCTKNLSHCVRDNTLHCKSPGRYIDVFSNKFYYICAKNGHKYIRFKLQCQKGYHLSKSKVKCVLDAHNGSSSYEDSSNTEKNRKVVGETKEDINTKTKKNTFECLNEGKFTYPDHCRKYYECKRVKSEFRRKIKKCDSNEVFDDDKKKCVNDESNECI